MNTIAKIIFDDEITLEMIEEIIDDLQEFFELRGLNVGIKVAEEMFYDEINNEVYNEDN